jgi:hypothetical protein
LKGKKWSLEFLSYKYYLSQTLFCINHRGHGGSAKNKKNINCITSKSFVPNGAKVVPKRAKTICANSCQNSSGPYVILLISGVSIPDRAEPRENTELDLNKPYVSLNGTNFWCQKETCQQRVPKRDVPTRAKMTCQRVPKKIRANACQK